MSRSPWRPCLPLLCALLLTSNLRAQAPPAPPVQDLSDPQVLLPLAVSVNSLDTAQLKPWHLKATYESFDTAGKALDEGTFEEWRLAPDKWKRTYTSPRFSQTVYVSQQQTSYETSAGAPPWPLSLIDRQLTHPMPQPAETDDTTPELRPLDLKTTQLNCFMFSQPLKKAKWPLGIFPTYCFKPNSPMLRAEVLDGSIQALRNEMVSFHDVFVAKEIALLDDGKPLLRIHLASLSTMSNSEAAEVASPPSASPGAPPQITVNSGVAAGHRILGGVPRYPREALLNHARGTVVLKAVIGTDGRIQRVRVDSSPDEYLSIASVAAVERWVYKPYTLNGQLVSVATTINVVYNTP